ncbi:MAG: transposase, partial [Thermoprotei archaeon]
MVSKYLSLTLYPLSMEFRELNDVEWNIIKTLLPPKPKRGRKASSDDRSLINGILYIIT